MKKPPVAILACLLLLGCAASQEDSSPGSIQGSYTGKPLVLESSTPENPSAVLAALYQPILEPFTATFTYTRNTVDDTPDSQGSYPIIKTTVSQDANLNIRTTESGRWGSGADHELVDGVLYVRTRPSPTDGSLDDVKGVDAGKWIPYYDYMVLASEAAGFRVSESLVTLGNESLAPGVSPQRPYRARAPLSVMDGEQFLPPPGSCVEFLTGLPENHVVRLDEHRWSIKCETDLAVLDTFVAEFDGSGRLTRFHNASDSYNAYDLNISYESVPIIEKPDTSWWNLNQSLVRDRVERLAKSTSKPQ